MTTAIATVGETKVVVSGTEEARAAIKAVKATENAPKVKKPVAKKEKAESTKKRNPELKGRALEVFEAGKTAGKKNGEIAREMAEKLSITYANAYYYVTRVFQSKAVETKSEEVATA